MLHSDDPLIDTWLPKLASTVGDSIVLCNTQISHIFFILLLNSIIVITAVIISTVLSLFGFN